MRQQRLNRCRTSVTGRLIRWGPADNTVGGAKKITLRHRAIDQGFSRSTIHASMAGRRVIETRFPHSRHLRGSRQMIEYKARFDVCGLGRSDSTAPQHGQSPPIPTTIALTFLPVELVSTELQSAVATPRPEIRYRHR